MGKSVVFFTKDMTPQGVRRLYEKIGVSLKGRTMVKVHSGEEGNQNFLKPEFWKDVFSCINNGVICECNTAYEGARNTTEKHTKLLTKHGWDKCFPCDIMDEDPNDYVLEIKNGNAINKDYVGNHILNYDSLLVLSHFKGHPMGGYGGALKQLSIGIASSRGKAYIHTAGKTNDTAKIWENIAKQEDFLASMADAAYAVNEYFKGNVVYINAMMNMSVDCDCCSEAEDPCMKDIGILASIDPVAIDQACIDIVKNSNDSGKEHFLERVSSRKGELTIEYSAKLGAGNREYTLVDID